MIRYIIFTTLVFLVMASTGSTQNYLNQPEGVDDYIVVTRGEDQVVEDTIRFLEDGYGMVFAHFSGLDRTGHDYGWMSDPYMAVVAEVDERVGRILDALDEMKLASNTLVVFTSDNGQMPGSSVADPLRDAKGYLYEGGIRVPMMIRWPGHIRAGAVDATPTISMDFAPTFLEAAGVKYGANEFDGQSLMPVASGKGALQRDALYWHYPHYCYHGMNDMGSVIRYGDYKYIHHYDNHDHELFDLKTDIGETINLYRTEPARAAELKAKLMAWLKSTEAQLPRLYADIPAAELPGRKREN